MPSNHAHIANHFLMCIGTGGLLVCSERSLTIWMRIRMVTWILKKWSEPSWRSCTWYSMLGFLHSTSFRAHKLHRCGLVLTVICGKAWRKGAYNEVQYSRFVEKHWTQVRGRAKANLVWSKNTGQNNISTMRCRTCSFPKPEGTADLVYSIVNAWLACDSLQGIIYT